MERVLVVGCAGAGKTLFSLKLSTLTELPVIHLDRHFWLPGWQLPDMNAWASVVDGLIIKPTWIMDGNCNSTLAARLEQADTVIFLDMPRVLCLWRVISRTLRERNTYRTDVAPGCPERFDWTFFKYVWNFRRTHRPMLMDALRNFKGPIIVLSKPSDVDGYFEELASNDGSSPALSQSPRT